MPAVGNRQWRKPPRWAGEQHPPTLPSSFTLILSTTFTQDANDNREMTSITNLEPLLYLNHTYICELTATVCGSPVTHKCKPPMALRK